MSLSEADDFLAESEVLDRILIGREDAEFQTETEFKLWTVDDVLVHLHFWNGAANLTLVDQDAFQALLDEVAPALRAGNLRQFENQAIPERGQSLRETWIARARDMAARWRELDPKRRLPWAGPPMSARSSMTARQMETWAHGFEVFDVFGIQRSETDRIRNIVVLGVNTFGWSHRVHGLDVPDRLPLVRLTAPSGGIWTFGGDGDDGDGEIAGPAVDFAAVVTQTRALSDTGLKVSGRVAQTWMAHAQCFAGPPVTPPAKGTRSRRHNASV